VALIAWDDSLNLNITEIDKQHQMLVSMVNDLYAAKQFEKGKEELANLLNRMSVYAAFHFAKEEDLLASHDYPQLDAHIKEHSNFEQKVFDFENAFADGKVELSGKVISVLGDWLIKHFKGSDKRCAQFLAERGIK
jgi:hemerythrin